MRISQINHIDFSGLVEILFRQESFRVIVVCHSPDRSYSVVLAAEGDPKNHKAGSRVWPDRHMCALNVELGSPLIVVDVFSHPFLSELSFVTELGIGAYMGFPFHDCNGVAVGAVSVMRWQRTEWRDEELQQVSQMAESISRSLRVGCSSVHP